MARRKPALPKNFTPFIDAARERHKQRPPNPGVRVNTDGERYSIESPYRRSDKEPWEVLVYAAFGTRALSACNMFLDQLAALCITDVRGVWAPDEIQLNAMLNIIAGARPKNEVQACLVAQMCAVH